MDTSQHNPHAAGTWDIRILFLFLGSISENFFWFLLQCIRSVRLLVAISYTIKKDYRTSANCCLLDILSAGRFWICCNTIGYNTADMLTKDSRFWFMSSGFPDVLCGETQHLASKTKTVIFYLVGILYTTVRQRITLLKETFSIFSSSNK